MIGVTGAMQYVCAGCACNGKFKLIDTAKVAPFRKIRNAFDELLQAAPTLQRVRFRTMFPLRITIPTWFVPSRRGSSR